jgi:hypothetical protein
MARGSSEYSVNINEGQKAEYNFEEINQYRIKLAAIHLIIHTVSCKLMAFWVTRSIDLVAFLHEDRTAPTPVPVSKM